MQAEFGINDIYCLIALQLRRNQKEIPSQPSYSDLLKHLESRTTSYVVSAGPVARDLSVYGIDVCMSAFLILRLFLFVSVICDRATRYVMT